MAGQPDLGREPRCALAQRDPRAAVTIVVNDPLAGERLGANDEARGAKRTKAHAVRMTRRSSTATGCRHGSLLVLLRVGVVAHPGRSHVPSAAALESSSCLREPEGARWSMQVGVWDGCDGAQGVQLYQKPRYEAV